MALPTLWLLTSSKAGDNAQARHLATALALPYREVKLAMKPRFVVGKPKVAPSLDHVDLSRSDRLDPPWPDLVIAIGRRLSNVALWIRAQSRARTCTVLMGVPKGEADSFDLAVVPLSHRATGPRVIEIGLPLMGIPAQQLAQAREAWRETFARLPRPLTALLIGGSTAARRLDPATMRILLREARSILARDGGSLAAVTSPRTPPDAEAILSEGLPKGALFFPWRPNAPNPYVGLLALADRCIVTGDSLSMIVEAARAGQPLAIAPVYAASRAALWLLEASRLAPRAFDVRRRDRRTRLLRRLAAIGTSGGPRDTARLHEYLYEHGWAVPLGQPFPMPSAPPPDDSAAVAARIRQLLGLTA
ncbi:MAG TPA: ELM1/GtrOC1 family putative glycosyltransferase [Methylomirabilota bacterium]|nr:ELM1/GtrOC1 family putative glycosyltransferase [Methylomirabilota bacterium]